MSRVVSLKIDPLALDKIKTMAKRYGIPYTLLMRLFIESYVGFSPAEIESLISYSEKFASHFYSIALSIIQKKAVPFTPINILIMSIINTLPHKEIRRLLHRAKKKIGINLVLTF